MKLVFIYGPPAAGKLTVAKELSKLTGFKVFHNHLAVDLAEHFFEFKSKPFYDIHTRIMNNLYHVILKYKVNAIATYCYCGENPKEALHLKKLFKKVEKCRGKSLLVRLDCSKKELLKRVRYEERKQ